MQVVIATGNLMVDDTIFSQKSLNKMIHGIENVEVLKDFSQEDKIGVASNFKEEDG